MSDIDTKDHEDVESLLDEMHDGYLADKLRSGKTRIDFAMVAANIAEDRYSAGSQAAIATIYLLRTHGLGVAKNFAEDLEHHEGH